MSCHQIRLAMLRAKSGFSGDVTRAASSLSGLNFGTPEVRAFLSGGTAQSWSFAGSGSGTSTPNGTRGPVAPFTLLRTDTNSYLLVIKPS